LPKAFNGPSIVLPLSGLFMSVIYPTLNSKGISCVPKTTHGAAAGVILFYTCLSAVLAPLAMGVVSDAMGGPVYGFALATVFAGLLFVGLLLNRIFDPTSATFERADETEYNHAITLREPPEDELRLDQFHSLCGADALVRSPAPWPTMQRDRGSRAGRGTRPTLW
jgi:MFS family permease